MKPIKTSKKILKTYVKHIKTYMFTIFSYILLRSNFNTREFNSRELVQCFQLYSV